MDIKHRVNDAPSKSPRALVYGSLNLDNVYTVEHIVAPGETLASTGFRQGCG